MPFVRGFLRVVSRRGRPEHPIAPGGGDPVDPDYGLEGPVDPDYGVDVGGEDGGSPEHPIYLPKPPPGIWPPPIPSHPIVPVPPTDPAEPGAIWPPVGKPGQGLPMPQPPVGPGQGLPKNLLLVLARIPEYGWKYVVVDLNAIVRPEPPTAPIPPREPK